MRKAPVKGLLTTKHKVYRQGVKRHEYSWNYSYNLSKPVGYRS